jgi:hypothetical protein
VYENEEYGKKFEAMEYIDVNEYAVACMSKPKLRVVRLPKAHYTFSLVPAPTETGGTTGKCHNFSVKSRDERIDWMREIMLAKALSQGQRSVEKIEAVGGFFLNS